MIWDSPQDAYTAGILPPKQRGVPLLHTWSLSVEEQFYLIFPLLLYVLLRFLPRYKVLILALVSALSFGLMIWMQSTSPSGAFYFSGARAWQLSAGALCALITLPAYPPKKLREFLSALSLIGMFISVILMPETPAKKNLKRTLLISSKVSLKRRKS